MECGAFVSQASGVRAITFHPDGRTLFCGLDDGLKVLIVFVISYTVELLSRVKH